jgi:hypothetical protein
VAALFSLFTIYDLRFTIYEDCHHVDAEKSEAPEADARAHDGRGQQGRLDQLR